MTPYTLRPLCTGQAMRWINTKSCVFIDAYLYASNDKIFASFEVREGGVKLIGTHWLMLARDSLGFYGTVTLYSEPLNKGGLINVDQLKDDSAAVRGALRQMLIGLAGTLRDGLGHYKRSSVMLHMLSPRACDPFDRIPNLYAESGRATRDAALLRNNTPTQ